MVTGISDAYNAMLETRDQTVLNSNQIQRLVFMYVKVVCPIQKKVDIGVKAKRLYVSRGPRSSE